MSVELNGGLCRPALDYTIIKNVTACQGRLQCRRSVYPLHGGSFLLFGHPPLVHDGQCSVNGSPPISDRHRPLLCRLKSRQIQRFEQCLVAGKDASLAVQLPVSSIQTFNRIGGVDDRPNISGKLEDWRDCIPIHHPRFHCIGIFGVPFFHDTVSNLSRTFCIWFMIDFLQISRKQLAVFVRDEFQGIAYLMNDAALIFGLRKCR